MKKTENTNKFAGSSMKNLPVGKIDLAPRGRFAFGSRRSASGVKISVQIPVFQVVTTPIPSPYRTLERLISMPSLATDSHVRAVERTSEMVMIHAVRLAKADAESMSVVIKPGAGTELSLELRQKKWRDRSPGDFAARRLSGVEPALAGVAAKTGTARHQARALGRRNQFFLRRHGTVFPVSRRIKRAKNRRSRLRPLPNSRWP